MSIENKIKNRRLELNLTLEEVANKTGVSKSTIKRWEDGYIKTMKSTKLCALAEVLQVHPTFFIFDDDETNTNQGENNGIIGNENQNNAIFNDKPLPPLDRAILTMCSGLDDTQKSEILSLATDMFSRNMRKKKKNKEE